MRIYVWRFGLTLIITEKCYTSVFVFSSTCMDAKGAAVMGSAIDSWRAGFLTFILSIYDKLLRYSDDSPYFCL